MEQATAHALMRDRGQWRGSISGLVSDADGELVLAAAPGAQAPETPSPPQQEGALCLDLPPVAREHWQQDDTLLPSGQLLAGPCDAGEERAWERVVADVKLPAGSSVLLEVALSASDAPPSAADWFAAPSLDALLPVVAGGGRYAWLRCTLLLSPSGLSPRLRQLRLATAAEDYLDYLPMHWRRNDADGLMSRWLRLIRGEYSRIEDALDAMPQLADPQFSRPQALDWLAQWFGLELPQIADESERRALIARAVPLLARRGSADSIAEFVELHTGVRPRIVEAWRDRRTWMLGRGDGLGFDTRLPALDPYGMAVANAVVGESGPLATHQAGLPLYAEQAYRFCVELDAYRAAQPGTLEEITRIVDREKPAHTDYRIHLIEADMRIGFQASIGIDTIIGATPILHLDSGSLNLDAHLPAAPANRIGDATLDGAFLLT